ncbi:MAG: hypothetical protein IJZ91_00275 [Oscillospiraceae bacterium]|nr:hypothetical protein [Oscillospiraceae bacterium]
MLKAEPTKERKIEQEVECARRCQRAGFDGERLQTVSGIQIHCIMYNANRSRHCARERFAFVLM